MKLEFNNWFPAPNENIDGMFFAFDILPQFSIMSDTSKFTQIVFGWLFWQLSLEINHTKIK